MKNKKLSSKNYSVITDLVKTVTGENERTTAAQLEATQNNNLISLNKYQSTLEWLSANKFTDSTQKNEIQDNKNKYLMIFGIVAILGMVLIIKNI